MISATTAWASVLYVLRELFVVAQPNPAVFQHVLLGILAFGVAWTIVTVAMTFGDEEAEAARGREADLVAAENRLVWQQAWRLGDTVMSDSELKVLLPPRRAAWPAVAVLIGWHFVLAIPLGFVLRLPLEGLLQGLLGVGAIALVDLFGVALPIAASAGNLDQPAKASRWLVVAGAWPVLTILCAFSLRGGWILFVLASLCALAPTIPLVFLATRWRRNGDFLKMDTCDTPGSPRRRNAVMRSVHAIILRRALRAELSRRFVPDSLPPDTDSSYEVPWGLIV